MALSGLEIYRLLPQTNCKECGFPTCLAFAMKLAAKQSELKQCPYVTEASKIKLEAASTPPIRLVALKAEGGQAQAGNEIVLFRHEKTFYHRPGIFVRVRAADGQQAARTATTTAGAYVVDYVGIKLGVDGIAVDAGAASAEAFAAAISAVRSTTQKPLILMAMDPAVMTAGAQAAAGTRPLLYAADEHNWQAMAEVARAAKAPLAVRAASLDKLAELTEALKHAGVEDLVLDPLAREPGPALAALTQLRRLAVKRGVRALGYPIITFPGEATTATPAETAALHIAKYAGFIVLDSFDPATVYPLLVLRQNLYTDPQKPIQVQPGVYAINAPTADAPVLVTTNFSITYFAVNNEVESSGWPAWLVVTDAEGMSVLTAWAAGKFDADRIAKAVKTGGVENKVNHRRVILPGQVAVLSGELEEALPGWEIMVGPKEAVDLPGYLKVMWGETAV